MHDEPSNNVVDEYIHHVLYIDFIQGSQSTGEPHSTSSTADELSLSTIMPITYIIGGAIGGVTMTILVALPVVITALLIVKRKQSALVERESSHTRAYNNPIGEEVPVMGSRDISHLDL